MLDSLKDMYISYPFMPIANPPDWYKNVKDIRCVVAMDASNSISQYRNGNYLRVWLVKEGGHLGIAVRCDQHNYEDIIEVPTYVWTAGAPATSSYMLVGSFFDAGAIGDGRYELQPDVLVFMQLAPRILYNDVEITGGTLHSYKGYNVSISKSPNGIMFFGAAGVGNGAYTTDPIEALGEDQQGLGARSINGLDGDVWIKGSYPVDVSIDSDLVMTVTHKTAIGGSDEED